MKLNERIMRMIDWPIQQTERLRDWLDMKGFLGFNVN